jgi:Zn-finger nucleic acid-binding protein
MDCPICNLALRPAGHGVWIAREELDKILVHRTPFDINWRQEQIEQVSAGSKRVPQRSPNPRFWSNLLA